MSTREDGRKSALIDQVLQAQAEFVPAEARDAIGQFTSRIYAHVSPEDIGRRSVPHLAHAAIALWQFAQERKPDQPSVRMFTPDRDEHGWTAHASLIQIVNDDMPFLVASITAALQRLGLTLKLVVHPVLQVERDADGRLIQVSSALTEATAAAQGAHGLESIMHIEVNTVADKERQSTILRRVRAVLDDVRAAVRDWPAMRALTRDLADRHAIKSAGSDPDNEAVAFLRWVADDHFTFLGYRHYVFSGTDGSMDLQIAPDDGMGILADQAYSVFDGLRNFQQMPISAQELFKREAPLFITKSNRSSTVHRAVPMDAIIFKEVGDDGTVIGEHLILGLFTSIAYNRSARDIPYLRTKVQWAISAAGLPEHSHSGKALAHILDTYPRDELFQMTNEQLLAIATGVLHLSERPRVALFTRQDPFNRFISCMVYVPRERYDSDLRLRMKTLLETELSAEVQSFFVTLDATALARIQFILKTPDGAIEPDVEALEKKLADLARVWEDRLQDALIDTVGEDLAQQMLDRYGKAFPAGYRECETAHRAVVDISRIQAIVEGGDLAMMLYRPFDAAATHMNFRLYHPGAPLSLSRVLPTLANLGLEVITERPYEIRPQDYQGSIWLHDFEGQLATPMLEDLETSRDAFHEAFTKVWAGETENDPLNRLVLSAGVQWREVSLLRAYCRFLRQIQFPLSQTALANTLVRHPVITGKLVDLFHAMHDPSLEQGRESVVGGHLVELDHALESVTSVDDDRVLRMLIGLVRETLRTNFYQIDADGNPREWIAFKLNSEAIEELPLPRPKREIFVYSPRVEGVHLRGGLVARGGLRWSDRRDDFRTEILGLMKAQMVKNAVIVPVGAKGGFVLKQAPVDGGRDAMQAEGIACYKIFIRALLEISDNIVDGEVVPPEAVKRYDGDDPYLVVAADKGTATFSDIANGVAEEYGFWLGDAFASGGSAGYDHKGMGITARGGWESVKRHFREIGKDIQREPFTCVGVGDMSGDVFGNGMLLSEQICLVGAFNHLHIFVDPDPDPAKSFAERKRLFQLPRSSWADYDPAVMSKGAQIYERSAKTLTLTPEIRQRFGIPRDRVSPNELIQYLLKAHVELLWFGGIGTYIKAAQQSHGDVGDKANDQIRINARDLRVQVIGEGANLGVTQAGRIEAAEAGVRLNTDFIDNSAGVDCSDHEVNIKILLSPPVRAGEMTREARNRLLADMTDEVGQLVLRDNYLQTQAITVALAESAKRFEDHVRVMRQLERDGILNRVIEGLPDDETIADRIRDSRGMTRPEFSVLISYAKIRLYDELLASDLPDDEHMVSDLVKYFPRPLRRGYREGILVHPLRREIIATGLANSIVNRAGPTFAAELADKTGMGAAQIARAYTVVRECFDLRALWGQIETGDARIEAEVQSDMYRWTIRLIERCSAWFLNNLPQPIEIDATVRRFREPILEAIGCLETMAPEPEQEGITHRREHYEAAGTDHDLAQRVARTPVLFGACDIARTAELAQVSVPVAAKIYTEVGDFFGISWLRLQAVSLPKPSHWRKQAVIAVIDDLYAIQSRIAFELIGFADGRIDPAASNESLIESWCETRAQQAGRLTRLLAEFRAAPEVDLAMLAIANRQLRSLTET